MTSINLNYVVFKSVTLKFNFPVDQTIVRGKVACQSCLNKEIKQNQGTDIFV